MATGGKLILTIDLGTSGPKVALFDEQAKCLAHEFEDVPLLLYDNGGAEQRPADWLSAIKNSYKRLISKTGIDPKRIVGINCTSQWSGTVALDKQGNPLMDSIIWIQRTINAGDYRSISCHAMTVVVC